LSFFLNQPLAIGVSQNRYLENLKDLYELPRSLERGCEKKKKLEGGFNPRSFNHLGLKLDR